MPQGIHVKQCKSDSFPHTGISIEICSNPADIASQDSTVANLVENKLWWSGPTWLSEDCGNWPRRPDINLSRELLDVRSAILLASLPQPKFVSMYNRLLRVTAWLLRLIHQVQKKTVTKSAMLKSEEFIRAKDTLIQLSQDAFYSAEKKLYCRRWLYLILMLYQVSHLIWTRTPSCELEAISRRLSWAWIPYTQSFYLIALTLLICWCNTHMSKILTCRSCNCYVDHCRTLSCDQIEMSHPKDQSALYSMSEDIRSHPQSKDG